MAILLADLLNQHNATPDVESEGVSINFCPDDAFLDDEGWVIDKALNALMDGVKARVDYHPYGREGGLVVYAEYQGERAWYDEHSENCWLT